jgi:hypothetical protein
MEARVLSSDYMHYMHYELAVRGYSETAHMQAVGTM